jgi:5'-nucleotidase
VELTLLHTGDIHSRIFPYSVQIGHFDAQLGLGQHGTRSSVGGAARLSYLLQRERARAERVLHLDGGDLLPGAAVFSSFAGEAEVRALGALGTSALLLSDHEASRSPDELCSEVELGAEPYDRLSHVADLLQRWATFPVLLANYHFEASVPSEDSPLGDVPQPYAVFDLDGLAVAVIGLGNLAGPGSAAGGLEGSRMLPLEPHVVAQHYVDLLRPITDVVVVISHLGLVRDRELIHRTSGIDVVLGGHDHIVLQPPWRGWDCAAVDANGRNYIDLGSSAEQGRRYCSRREVLLCHGGAYAKFLGRLELVLSDEPRDLPLGVHDPVDRFEVVSHEYTVLPVHEEMPEDPVVKGLLEPYVPTSESIIAYAPQGSQRGAANGGDSALGNLVATAVWSRLGAQGDFALMSTTRVGADIAAGLVTVDDLFHLFPFDDGVVRLRLGGGQVEELLHDAARRSASTGCESAVQVAGMRLVMDCQSQPDPSVPPGQAEYIYLGVAESAIPCTGDDECGGHYGACDLSTGRCWQPLDASASYQVTTSSYLASGGGGFNLLAHATARCSVGVELREALHDFIRLAPACGSRADGSIVGCRTDADCIGTLGDGHVCACPSAVDEGDPCSTRGSCPYAEDPGPGDGACVLASCRTDVAAWERARCEDRPCNRDGSPCARGGELCKALPCIDARLGSRTDGRIRMVGR